MNWHTFSTARMYLTCASEASSPILSIESIKSRQIYNELHKSQIYLYRERDVYNHYTKFMIQPKNNTIEQQHTITVQHRFVIIL